jgi:hypothetical protein
MSRCISGVGTTMVRARPFWKALAVAMMLIGARTAQADVFEFKDHDGFEKCMQLDHLVEKVKTAKGSQSRMLEPVEIQLRCIESAVKLLTAHKDKDAALEYVKTTKRLSAPQNALDLVGVLIDTSLPACNDMAAYSVLTRALSFPKDTGTWFARTRSIVKRCLKDKEFRADFLEEVGGSDANVIANSCQILLEEKLVKSCKGAK